MKAILACLALALALCQARDLTNYGGCHNGCGGHGQKRLHDCREEVGFKIVKTYGYCAHEKCGHDQYCKTLEKDTCKYFPIDKCPKGGLAVYKCDPIKIQCGKKTCGFGYKCGEKKVCGTDYHEYHDDHKTTVETTKCWIEKECEKAEPPKKCEIKAFYGCYKHGEDLGHYKGEYRYKPAHGDPKCKCDDDEYCKVALAKICVIDPKYLEIANGVKCGDGRCKPGHKCSAACEVCKYKSISRPYCAHISTYDPIPCGYAICTPHETCVIDKRKVCSVHDGRGYGYYEDGKAAHASGYHYYEKGGYYTEGYYYYYSSGGHHHAEGHGSSGHGSSGHGRHSGHHGGSGSGGKDDRKDDGKKDDDKKDDNDDDDDKKDVTPAAASRSQSAADKDTALSQADIAAAGNGQAASTAASESLNSRSASAIQFSGGNLRSAVASIAENAAEAAAGTSANIVGAGGK